MSSPASCAYGRASPRAAILTVILLSCTIATGIAWASLTDVETGIRADAVVVPAGNNRKVMHLEGGVVEAVLVREGETVRVGQVVARIAPAQAEASRGERLSRLESLRARAERLAAEAEGREPKLGNSRAEMAEKSLFQENRNSFNAGLTSLQQQVKRFSADAAALRAKADGLRGQVDAAARAATLHAQAAAGGTGSRSKAIEAESQLAAVKGQLAGMPQQVQASEAGASEAEAKMAELRARRISEARKGLTDTLVEIGGLEQSIEGANDRLARTEMASPVSGTVQSVLVHEGETLQPSSALLEIVPDDALEIRAMLRPEDVRGIKPGMPARIRLSAYDVATYGTLSGTLISVSPDAEENQRTGQSFFKARIVTREKSIGGEPLKPGLRADVSILTGERRIIDYLTGPIFTAGTEIFRER
jgi:adhesin transport system membrane fusion protein